MSNANSVLPEDMIGSTFGRLTVRAFSRLTKSGKIWLCECSCGEFTEAKTGHLRSGSISSCGCLRRETAEQLKLSHGHARAGLHTRIYDRWKGILARCYNPEHKSYENYGGRGIRVCERWHDFQNFIDDMGFPPSGLIIDRRNNDGNYEPGNCRWTSHRVNANNRRPRRATI